MNRPTTTNPWTPEEYIRWRGMELVYTAEKGHPITVHLPGRISVPISRLHNSGYPVTMPKMMRKEVTR